MKKKILVLCLAFTALGITAFAYVNRNVSVRDKNENTKPELDLVYKIDSRFIWTITKEDLENARSIVDILPENATQSVGSYQTSKVAILDEEAEPSEHETGSSEVLNPAQIKLLQTTDYSTQFYIHADFTYRSMDPKGRGGDYLIYYISVIPEKEAEYSLGQDALIEYLRKNSKEKTAVIKQEKLKPGRVFFTVTKNGTVSDVRLNSSSGYPSVDEALVDLITNIPEKWNSATNSAGEKVDQELVFFFGLQGC